MHFQDIEKIIIISDYIFLKFFDLKDACVGIHIQSFFLNPPIPMIIDAFLK